MPANHSLSVVNVTKLQKRLVDDMYSRNDIFTDKEVFTKIVRMENPMSPFLFVSSILGGMNGAVDNMFEPVMKGLAAEFIKILEVSDFQEHARIIDVSQVPSVLVAGVPFTLGIDRAFADTDETLMINDEETIFRVESRRTGLVGTDFTLQLIGMPGEMKSGSILQVNDAIHSGYGNSKGEASMNSNTLTDDLQKETTFYNMMSIIRYGFTETGSAMSDEVYKFLVRKGMDGSETEEVKVDISVKVLRKVMMALDRAIMFNKPNFDPVTKKIANMSAAGRYHERPYYAGIYWMLDQCPWKWYHAKSSTNADNISKLDFILQYVYNKTGKKQTLFAMAEGIGLEWLRDTILKGGLEKTGVNLYQKVEGGDKLKLGFEADEYYTAHGRIVIYDINRAFNNWGEFKQESYNGITHRARSKHIYFMPSMVTGANGSQKKPCDIFYKQGNGINRAFAFGYQRGITGEAGGMTGDQLLSMQDEFIQRNARNDRYRMDSTVDGKEFHVLMQMVPYMDVRNVTRLTLY